MSMRSLTARIERFPVRGAFVIARGAKTHVDVVVATATDGAATGRGEGTAIYYRGETAESVLAQVEGVAAAVAGGATRPDLLALLPPGAARNAADAALWDLEAKASGVPVWRMLGLPEPKPLLTAYTISLGEPGAMAAAAKAVAGRELLKVKLGGDGGHDGVVERVRAVRAAAPDARLIVDANEAWGQLDIERAAAALGRLGVELIEQPVPAGHDHLLDDVRSAVPLCADESVHDRASLDHVVGRYALINVKLDKAGGLTEAHALVHAAKARGIGVMTGCMLGTSLAVAPAFMVAMQGAYADLDGPLLIEDRAEGMRFAASDVWPPERELWADRARRSLRGDTCPENHMQLAHGTIVAVADGETFTLYRNGGSDGAPHLTAIGTPGVGSDAIASGGRHHSSAANPDDAQLVEDGHAGAVAGVLNRMALDNDFAALVVIAPAKTLGELRRHWHKALTAKLTAEIGKEMAHASIADIAALVAKHN